MSSKAWKVLSSEYLFNQPPWLVVRKEKVQLPSAHIIENYYVQEFPEWVTIIAITKDEGKYVIVRQYRHAIRQVHYELCAGLCDPEDPTPMDSAKRELLEETGYGNGDWKFFTAVSANPTMMTNFTHCFLATGVEKIAGQNLEKSEDISVHLFTEEELKKMLLEEGMVQALHLAPLWRHLATK